MQGHVESSHNLGAIEGENKRDHDRAVRHCFLISAKMGRKDSVETIKQIFKEQSTALRRYKTDKLGATAAKNTAPNISHLLKQATMLWIRLDRDFSSPATHLFRTYVGDSFLVVSWSPFARRAE